MRKSLTKFSLKNTKACLFLVITPSPQKNKQNEEIVAGFAKSTKRNGGACADLDLLASELGGRAVWALRAGGSLPAPRLCGAASHESRSLPSGGGERCLRLTFLSFFACFTMGVF